MYDVGDAFCSEFEGSLLLFSVVLHQSSHSTEDECLMALSPSCPYDFHNGAHTTPSSQVM